MAKPKQAIKAKELPLRAYDLIHRAVFDGIDRGLNRATKHAAHPSKDVLQDVIVNAVMDELTETIDFENGADDED